MECLPMDDMSFIVKLSVNELLHGDAKSQISTLPTQAAKASYFLDHVIKRALEIDDTSSFDNLLFVMGHCGYAHAEKLAHEMKSEIVEANDIKPGM